MIRENSRILRNELLGGGRSGEQLMQFVAEPMLQNKFDFEICFIDAGYRIRLCLVVEFGFCFYSPDCKIACDMLVCFKKNA